MKFKFVIILFVLLLLTNHLVLSKSTKHNIALSYGSGIVTSEGYFIYNEPILNLNFHYQYNITSNFKIGLSSGYGKYNYLNNVDHIDDREDEDNRLKEKGIPIELEIIISSYSKGKIFIPFIGFGIGHYDYEITNIVHRNNTLVSDTKVKIKGFAQYFTFGFDIKIAKNIYSFLQFKKLGFSNLEAKGQYPRYNFYQGASYQRDIKTKAGLEDLGIAFGILFSI